MSMLRIMSASEKINELLSVKGFVKMLYVGEANRKPRLEIKYKKEKYHFFIARDPRELEQDVYTEFKSKTDSVTLKILTDLIIESLSPIGLFYDNGNGHGNTDQVQIMTSAKPTTTNLDSDTGKCKPEKQEQDRVLSVLEAKRVHGGKATVLGTIVSVSDMYVMEMENPVDGKPEYKDAKSIQLEDTENLDEYERLDVILYDNMVNKVVPGEIVKVTGNMHVEDRKGNSKSKKKITVLHATSIKYLHRKEVFVTEKDIKTFHKFITYPKVIERLTAMFAPNIIGHDDVKRGLLRSVVGGINRGKKGGGRVDTLMVGDMGTAKSKLGSEAAEIKPNSRHVNAPHATTKTITAIPEKVNDSVILILGAIPLSKGAICAIDEITSFPIEDQARLLSVLEEGKIHIDKLGMRSVIDSPTTIMATANPVQTQWSNSQIISMQEVELKRNLIDRFTQIYGFRDKMEEDETKRFVWEMDKINQRHTHNYNFLRKYLIHASGIKDVKFTYEARYILNEFWANAKVKELLTNRMLNGLYKIAEAQAKLQLRGVVDEEIAEQVLDDVRLMMVQYGETIAKIMDPRELAIKTCQDVLRKRETGMTIEAMCELAIQQNEQIANYLGYIWTIEQNHKLRQVVDSLLNHPRIRKVGVHPIVLRWLSDTADTADIRNKDKYQKNSEDNDDHKYETVSDMSAVSERTK